MTRRVVPPAIALGLLAAGRCAGFRRAAADRGQRRAAARRLLVVRRHRHGDRLPRRVRHHASAAHSARSASPPSANGDFDVTTRPISPLLRRAAARNDGSVNLLLLVKTEAGKAVLPFTRKLSNGRWVARSSISPRLPLHPWGKGDDEHEGAREPGAL